MSASNPLIRNRLAILPGFLDFLDTGRFTAQVTNVVQLRASHASGADDFDLIDDLRVKRENAFDSVSKRNLAHRECRADAAVFLGNTHALKDLDAFLVALSDFDVHFDGVSRMEDRQVCSLL